ncbi:glycosyltransferase family 87 protein [Mycobacterium vicinigordonae]|uniref:DUF2029 domain-containing protein n=1 Tax=Mycobacterium vicinigordonae TaxID=1719132 RepID=A0A7D6HRY4_9MYCO|nr:glycosyltransferase family 87 protein [Mycobacterium vicinigordonae]QLL05972.1 DUF2029 domain-containing protein [Mycobacterium vicinigordonae]
MAVGVAGVLAVAALLVQQALEPFNAGSHLGLFTNAGDLDVYRHGGLQVLHRRPLYSAELPSGGWFTYPPFAATLFVSLGIVSFAAAQWLWMLVSFVALTATVWRCATVLGYRADRRLALLSVALALVALDTEPVRGTLWPGQVNLVLMAVVVWDLTRPSAARLRGWSVGVAAGVKLTAIVFVPYLLITRQWRPSATAIATALTIVLLTWIVLPTDSATYWTNALFETERIGPLTHPGNFSIGGDLATWLAADPMPLACWLAGVGLAGVGGYYAACAVTFLMAVPIVLACRQRGFARPRV